MGLAGVTGITATGAGVGRGGGQEDHDTIRVPDDHETVQDAVDAANEGDLVLVGEGTYAEAVDVTTPEITLRGLDRNAVVIDGEFERNNGVDVEADGVAIENLTVRHFQRNAVYWDGVDGFRGSFLTAYNNGYYGIYATHSRNGRFEYSYASGHPDAGFYLGRNKPFEAVISNVVAEYNALGYSGTSTGEGLRIQDSIWRHNMAGIVPNTLWESDPPQRASRIVGNVVYNNGNEDAPAEQHTYPMFGTGILLWSGNDNLVEDNVVRHHPNFGIAVHPNVDEPSGNVIRENLIHESERADLGLGAPAGDDNRFEANQFATSLPPDIQEEASEGDDQVTEVFEEQKRRAEDGDYPSGDWRDQPEPGDQPTMPDPEAPPRPATRSETWGSRRQPPV